MADEKVNIVVKVITKTKQLDALLAKLRAVEAMEDRLSSGKNLQKYANASGSALAKATSRWKKHTDFVDSAIRMFGKTLTKFLGLAIKGVLLEMGLLAAAMVGWHALIKGGQYIVKAYNGAMQLLAGGAAAATVALATVSAAIREQQAAMYAYRGKGAKEFGSSMNQTVMAMRNLQMNADLASLGVEALNSAFGVMSKTMSSTQINASGKSLKALMDFGAAGQDPKKSIQQVATVVAALNDEKKSISNVISEAKKLGPEMEKALKDANVKTKAQFKDMLFSGELAKKGGVLGQFEAVNTTLIGQLQKYFTILRGEFADFGMQFLEPAKDAFEKLYRIISRDLARILLTVQSGFGAQTFIDGLVNGVDKLSNWMVKAIRQYLPAVQGMFRRIGDWLGAFKRGWNLVLERMRPFIDGARVVEKAFGRIWQAIKDGSENMKLFNNLLQQNEGTVVEFGSRIADLIRDVSDLLFRMKSVFFEILPFINDVLSGIGMLVRGLTKMLTIGSGGGFMKALAPLMAFQIFGSRMAGAAGKLMPTATGQQKGLPFSNVQTMPVTAQNVYVNGQPVPGAGAGAGAAAGAAGLGSGRLSTGAGGGGMAGPIHPYGPTQQAYNAYYGPALSRVYSTSSAAQLADFKDKTEAIGNRALNTAPGKGILVGQAVAGHNMPTMFSSGGIPIGNQFVPERDFQQTTAVGINGAPVFQDVRARGGVYVNERGIAMGASQTSQKIFGRMQVDPRMRLGESMRVGKLMKQGFAAGDTYRAGMDRRAFERQEIINAGGMGVTPITGVHTPGMPAATAGRLSLGVSRGPDVDYSRMGDKRLARYARARGLDTSGGKDSIVDLLKKNDRDRMLARAAVSAQGTPAQARYEAQMSHAFKYGPAYSRYFKDVTETAPDGTKTTRQVMRDPGLTAREGIHRAGMRFASRASDIAAITGNKARGIAGRFQGAMAYLNDGRFDPTLNDGKGDFVDVSKMRKEALQRMKDARQQQNRGRLTTRLSYAREMSRIARSETKFGAGQKRFAQSGTGRMGTSMGLALASQYAPEEMRGAMALGGTLSMIDPRLGIAVAGVGGALKAKSVGAGALAGMAGGAQIGAMFGPWGAAIGAGIGLIAGGIMGAINKHKDNMKKATKAAQNSINSVFTGIAASASRAFDFNREAMERGEDMSKRGSAFGNIVDTFKKERRRSVSDIKSSSAFATYSSETGGRKEDAAKALVGDIYKNQKRYGMQISEQDKADALLNPEKYITTLMTVGGTFETTLTKMEGVNSDRMKQLTKDTGKSAAELEILAQELGVNLYDATAKYTDIAKRLGAAMVKTSAQLNAALVDSFLQTGNRYRTRREKREANKAIDMSSRGLRDVMMDPNASAEEKQVAIDAYFENFAAQQLALAGGDAFEAYQQAQRGFGTKGSGTLFGEGQVFGGLGDTGVAREGSAVTADFRKEINTQFASQLAGMVQAEGFSINQKALESRVGALSDSDLNILNTLIKGGNLNFKDSAGNVDLASIGKKLEFLGLGQLGTGQKALGLEEVPTDKLDAFAGNLEAVAKKMGLDYAEFERAVTLYKTTTEGFFKGSAGGPDWWQKGLVFDGKSLKPPDTATPRGGAIGDTTTSKLSQTMARHQAMDSQLAGKRSVTSSWRNFNLGSSNSDHVTGRAYDLVGQNLGKYATMVHQNGGFAEFHGNMAERHLHVVPGPTPGVGDTTVPAMNVRPVSTMSGPSMAGSNYTITINGANQSPEAIANMVVAKLDDRERKYRER